MCTQASYHTQSASFLHTHYATLTHMCVACGITQTPVCSAGVCNPSMIGQLVVLLSLLAGTALASSRWWLNTIAGSLWQRLAQPVLRRHHESK